MKHKPAFYALVRLYAELAGKVPLKHRDPERLRRDMWHVEKVIRMFEPGFDVATIRPKKHYRANRTMPRGLGSRSALDILREAGEPLTVREVARRALARQGITDPSDYQRQRVEVAVRRSLDNHLGRAVKREGKPAHWSVNSA